VRLLDQDWYIQGEASRIEVYVSGILPRPIRDTKEYFLSTHVAHCSFKGFISPVPCTWFRNQESGSNAPCPPAMDRYKFRVIFDFLIIMLVLYKYER
jgi:hypothetical protein